MATGFRSLAYLFNCFCTVFVAVFIFSTLLPKIWNERDKRTGEFTHHDFGQFYMGATIARAGDWGSLYPVPIEDSPGNPGWTYGSTMKPHYAELAMQHGVGSTFRYIQLPPNALFYYPLALLSYQNAYRLWHVVMACFVVIAARQAGLIYQAMVDRPLLAEGGSGKIPYLAGWVTLLVGCSPLMNYTAHVSNTGPLLAACFGASVLGLLHAENRRSQIQSAMGIVIGGFTKFAPGVVMPLMIAMRRWRSVAWTIAIGVIITAVTMAITGTAVWLEFLHVIWPPLQKSSDTEACQSVWGFLSRVTHQFPLNSRTITCIKIGQDLVIAAILLMLVRRKAFWNVPEHVAAAAAALMAWLLIFAPIAWQFYHCMLTPLWGWLVWEAVRGKAIMKTVVIAAILLTLLPSPGNWWGRFPEPIASRQLFSAILILLLGCWRLSRKVTA